MLKGFFVLFFFFFCHKMGAIKYFDLTKRSLKYFPPYDVSSGSLSYGDYDKDGLVDFSGIGGSPVVFLLYHQNASLVFSSAANTATFPFGVPSGTQYGRIQMIDVNGDSLLDIFFCGVGVVTSAYYMNMNGNAFALTNNNSVFLGGLVGQSNGYFDFVDLLGNN